MRLHQEIGIRMALGATRGQAVLLILRRGLLLTAAGLLAGILAARGLSGVLGAYLWGVSPTDPWTFITVAGLLAAASTLACYIAARRVARTILPRRCGRNEIVMPGPSRRLPERPSLEQLRKQAKDHLETLRAADPNVKLAAPSTRSRVSTASRAGRRWSTTSRRSGRQLACGSRRS